MSKIENFWENATAKDIERVMAGETVEARFRDWESVKWVENGCSLAGWCAGVWTSSSGLSWVFCQVYREQSWHANKPDPGEGWRLLGKFPDEGLKPGDEAWDLWDDKQWSESESANGGGNQVSGVWYRRRIEAVEDPGGDWEPTDEEFQYAQDLCRVPKGTHDPVEFRKFVDKAKAGELSFTCSFVWEGPRAKVGDRIQHPNGCWLEITESGFKIEAALNTIKFTG